jgi:uncharacterized protein YbbC (DUF1343 family)
MQLGFSFLSAKSKKISTLLLVLCFTIFSHAQELEVGAQRINNYLPFILGKNVAIIANQTSMVGNTHLVDTLLSLGVTIKVIFSPEHGFRGAADAGAKVNHEKDPKTGLTIFSLYGKTRRIPDSELKGIDVLIFDLQDVGARFYTYISTLSLAMEACAANNVAMIVLDRPNPNGFYVDGPVNELTTGSFVALHPIPIVHGLTVGEYAMMAMGERWLNLTNPLDIRVIKCKGYDHSTMYEVPVKPSPNLPNNQAIYLYPSLCLFEPTEVSVGRGTDKPFQIIGAPHFPKNADYTFTPKSVEGASKPMYENELCYGYDLEVFAEFIPSFGKIILYWIIESYNFSPNKEKFFSSANFFDNLAGGPKLREQIIAGMSEDDIRASWEPALSEFKAKRKNYLLYPDFPEKAPENKSDIKKEEPIEQKPTEHSTD